MLCLSVPVIGVLFQLWGQLFSGDYDFQATATSVVWASGKSVALALCVAMGTTLIATPVAWLTICTDVPFRKWFGVLLLAPFALPSYVAAVLVTGSFSESVGHGFSGALLSLLFTYPLVLAVLQSRLLCFDASLWDASRSLGKSPVETFFSVLWPGIRGAVLAGASVVFLYAMGDFGAVSLTRYDNLSFLVYLRQTSLFGQSEAAVLSIVLAVLVVGMSVWLSAVFPKTHLPQTANSHRPLVVPLGAWRFVAACWLFVLTVVFLFLPLGVVASWAWRGTGFTWEPLGNALLQTVFLSCMGALVIACASLVFRLWRRAPSVVKHASRAAYALPGVVVALGVGQAALAFGGSFFYQTVWILLFAYFVRFFDLARSHVQEGTAGLPRFLLVARSLGASGWRRFWGILVPLAAPCFLAAFGIVAIAIAKELPATLLLAPTDTKTLATTIWSLSEDEYLSELAPYVLLMVLVAIVGLRISGVGSLSSPRARVRSKNTTTRSVP